jgi:hypothetical protein
LIAAIATLPMIAATTAFLDSCAMGGVYSRRKHVPGLHPTYKTVLNG